MSTKHSSIQINDDKLHQNKTSSDRMESETSTCGDENVEAAIPVVKDDSVVFVENQSSPDKINGKVHADKSNSETRDLRGGPNQGIIQPSLSPPSRKRCDQSLEEELSSYEVVDVACSPFEGAQMTGLEVGDSPTPQQQKEDQFCLGVAENDQNSSDNDDESFLTAQSSLQSHRREKEMEGNSANDHSFGSEPRSLSSFIVNDDQQNQQQQPSYMKQRIVQDLGKGYRTPPVSPVVSLLTKEGAFLARGTSTPLKSIDVGGDCSDTFHRRQKNVKNRMIVEEEMSELSLDDNNDVSVVAGKISQDAVPVPPQVDDFLSDGSCDSTREEQSSTTSTQNMSHSSNKSKVNATSNQLEESLISAAENTAHTENNQSNDNLDNATDKDSLAISIHISEESSASLYETRDVSCSPIKNNSYHKPRGNNVNSTNNKRDSCHSDTTANEYTTSKIGDDMSENECTKSRVRDNDDDDDISRTSDDDDDRSIISGSDDYSIMQRDEGETSISPGGYDKDTSLAMSRDHGDSSSDHEDHANSSVFSSNLAKNDSNLFNEKENQHISKELNYTRLGESPTSTRRSTVTSATSSRRRSKAATFFDVSMTSDEEDRQKDYVKIDLGESQFADTQPIDRSQHFPMTHHLDNSRQLSLKSATSVVLEIGTEDGDGSTTEDDQFDLDRLKQREEARKLDCEEEVSVLVDDSMKSDRTNNNNSSEEGETVDKNAGKIFSFSHFINYEW